MPDPGQAQLLSFNDLLGMDLQAEPPSFIRQPFWLSRYPLELEKIMAQSEILALFPVLCRDRGIGVVRPSPPAAARRSEEGMKVPSAFYRMQLNRESDVLKAAELVEYLGRLGISHFYTSPFLRARPGSSHGYDIIDHAKLNPEIGSREDFETLVAALERHGMALLLDIVPNHMGVGADNHWWMDVLENGEAASTPDTSISTGTPCSRNSRAGSCSRASAIITARFWKTASCAWPSRKAAAALRSVITSSFSRSPPKPMLVVLRHDLQRLEDRLGAEHNGYLELQNLISAFVNLPPREENSTEMLRTRHRNKEVNKRILARLCREIPEMGSSSRKT